MEIFILNTNAIMKTDAFPCSNFRISTLVMEIKLNKKLCSRNVHFYYLSLR